jgi:hypothetical protein
VPGVFVLMNEGELHELIEQPYDTEDVLQGLLARYPRLLTGDDTSSPAGAQWLLVEREVGVPDSAEAPNRWSVDHLFIDQDAVPTLVEVKRSTDTRIRREVVGQMLDYAANAIVYWPVETIRAKFEARCEREGQDPLQVLTETLGADPDAEGFWQDVKTNLQAGKVRMLFVADVVPPELRRIVEFLNVQMDPAEVLALEVRQFVGKDLKTLVPRLIGQTAEALQRKRPGGGNAGPTLPGGEEFLQAMAQAPAEQQPELNRLYAWAKSLEDSGLCRLYTSIGKGRWVLNPRLMDEDSVLVSIWNDKGASITPFRTVLERRAPHSVGRIEELCAPVSLGQGKVIRIPSDQLLRALEDAYREAAGVSEPESGDPVH